MIDFIARLLKAALKLPEEEDLDIECAHRSTNLQTPMPPDRLWWDSFTFRQSNRSCTEAGTQKNCSLRGAVSLLTMTTRPPCSVTGRNMERLNASWRSATSSLGRRILRCWEYLWETGKDLQLGMGGGWSTEAPGHYCKTVGNGAHGRVAAVRMDGTVPSRWEQLTRTLVRDIDALPNWLVTAKVR